MKFRLFLLLSLLCAHALGADVAAKLSLTSKEFVGKITEWRIPTPKYGRDPTLGKDGRIYYAVRDGGKIGSFDTVSKRFQEWDVPAGMKPMSPVVTSDGRIFFGGAGNNSIGELDPSTGKVRLYAIPTANSFPYTLTLDADENIWFTERKVGNIAKLERSTGKITEYPIGVDPYALLVDTVGNVWVTRKDADRVSRFNPKTGLIAEVNLGLGAMPRRLSIAPDGVLWVTLYGTGKLAKIDTTGVRIVKEFDLPGGSNAGPYAVNADINGRIWVSEIQTDSLVVFDPLKPNPQVIKLPTKDTGVRNAVITVNGRYWYIGSHSGTIGVVE